MSSAHKVNLVFLAKLLDDVRPEDERNTSLVLSPARNVFWVRPQQVTKEPCVWHVLWPLHGVDLRQKVELW